MRGAAQAVDRSGPLRFGDPLGCQFWWLDPDRLSEYGAHLRRLANRVELAADALARAANLPEEAFAGEAADTLRRRARGRASEAGAIRDNLRALGRAVDGYAGVLTRHRRALEELREVALARGLRVEGHRIWPPVDTLPGDSSQRDVDRWEADWKAYEQCFQLRIEIRDARRQGTRELVRALAEHAGVHPDEAQGDRVAPGHGSVRFGELRREAADEAMEAVVARDEAEALRSTLDVLRRREQHALGELERLALSGASPESLATQADRVALLHREVSEARAGLRQADAVAEREQAEADRAAHRLQDVESSPGRHDPRDRRDRLG